MVCRLRFITSTGALLPAEASDVMGLDADTIDKARMSFDCPYCERNYMIAIELPVTPPYMFKCDECSNEYNLLEGADGNGKREAVDLLNIQNVIRDKQAVGRLGRNHHSSLFSLIALGAKQYLSGGLLFLSLVLFGGGLMLLGSALGIVAAAGAIVSLFASASAASLLSARVRRQIAETGVEVSSVDAIWRYRGVYRYVRAQRAQEYKNKETEADAQE